MTRTALFHVVVGTRPTTTPDGKPIPDSADIYNAPRPLYGWQTWTDKSPDFPSFGWFFAAIDPDAGDELDRKYSAEYAIENARMDSVRLLFVSEEQAFEAGVLASRERYAGTPVEAELDSMIADEKYRSTFIRNGLEAMKAVANDALISDLGNDYA